MRSLFAASALVTVCALASGCGFFAPKPALPRQASTAPSADELMSAVRRADIIYSSIEAFETPLAEHPVWKILAALKRSGHSFSIAWEGIEIDQQPILDEIVAKPDQLENALARLRWDYAHPVREYSKSILRATPGIGQLAIGAPKSIEAKIRSGTRLNSDERTMVPHEFRAPADGLENFAERFASRRGLTGTRLTNLYRAHLFTEQFAAENIVAFMREHTRSKLLVFLRQHEAGADEVIYFVEQKLKVRQITLERIPRGPAHLITSSRTGGCSALCL